MLMREYSQMVKLHISNLKATFTFPSSFRLPTSDFLTKHHLPISKSSALLTQHQRQHRSTMGRGIKENNQAGILNNSSVDHGKNAAAQPEVFAQACKSDYCLRLEYLTAALTMVITESSQDHLIHRLCRHRRRRAQRVRV